MCSIQIVCQNIPITVSVISEPLLNKERKGFRQGKSFMDSIFTIQQLLERLIKYIIETHLLF
jgi:hypothetical protein